MSKAPTCYEVIGGLDAAITQQLPRGVGYLVLGGIASAALRHPDTEIYEGQQLVVAAPSSAEPTIRGNGTRRDIDILVTASLDKDTSKNIKAAVSEATDGQLVVSVFDFDKHQTTSAAERAKAVVTGWSSRRTIDEQGTLRHKLHSLTHVVDKSAYEPWLLGLPQGAVVQILNPVGHVLAYKTRSISGLRHKDGEKVCQMEQNVSQKMDMATAIHEGPFSTWHEFSQAIASLNKGLPIDERFLDEGVSRAHLTALRCQGRLLKMLEKHESLVKLAQGPAQRLLNFAVKAK